MRITAQSENNAQEILRFQTNHTSYGGYWSAVRIVGWITQDTTNKRTTLFFKWQRACEKNSPFWNDSHSYKVSLAGQTNTVSFALGKATTAWADMCPAQSITVAHDSSGAFSGSLSATGYKYWESDSGSVTVEFPTITSDEPTPEPPAPIETDDNPHYYIYVDGELLYTNGMKEYQLINPVLTLEVNKSGSLTFDIPTTNVMYERLAELKSTVEVRQGNEVIFRGRIISQERNFYNTKSVYCEGYLSWLYDSVQKPYTFNGPARDLYIRMLSNHNAQVTADRKIYLQYCDISTNVKVENKSPTKTLKDLQTNLLDTLGGFLVPYYTPAGTSTMYRSSYDRNTSQVIQFGKNLIDFRELIDASEVFTAVMPVGKDGLMLSGDGYVQDDNAVNAYGRIIEVVNFPDIETASQLEQEARNYLRTGISIASTIEINAIDLHYLNRDVEKIRIGDTVRFVSAPHEKDVYMIATKMKLALQDASKNQYTFGTIPKGITDLQKKADANRYVITE